LVDTSPPPTFSNHTPTMSYKPKPTKGTYAPAGSGIAQVGVNVASAEAKGGLDAAFGTSDMVMGVGVALLSSSLKQLFSNSKRLRLMVALELVIAWLVLAHSPSAFPNNGIIDLNCASVDSAGVRSTAPCVGFGQWNNVVATGILVFSFAAGVLFNIFGRDLGELGHSGGILANQWVANSLLWGISLGMLEANIGSADLFRTVLMVLLGVTLSFLLWNRQRAAHVEGNTRSLGNPGFILAAAAFIVTTVFMCIELTDNAENVPEWGKLLLLATVICIFISIIAVGANGESNQKSDDYETWQRRSHAALISCELILIHFAVWTYIKGARD